MRRTEQAVLAACPKCRVPVYAGPLREFVPGQPDVIDIGDIIGHSMPCPRCGTELLASVEREYEDRCYVCGCAWGTRESHTFEWQPKLNRNRWWCERCEDNVLAMLVAEFSRPLARVLWYPLRWASAAVWVIYVAREWVTERWHARRGDWRFMARFGRLEDEETARRLETAVFAELPTEYRPTEAARHSAVATGAGPMRVVAMEAEEIVGTVRFRVDEDCMRIMGLVVLPTKRRQGVARRMIELLEALAEKLECRVLGLHTVKETGNVAVFKRLGFRVVSAEPDESSVSVGGEPVTDVYMERTLSRKRW